MSHRVWKSATVAGCVLAFAAAPALAQRSKDTMRIGVNNPFPVLSGYHLPVDDAGAFYREIYDSLVAYDEYNKHYVPMLAKTWKRVAPDTLEFELRDDIKFHNGNPFNADDVVATLNYIGDPKVKLTYKGRYAWVKEVQKLGPYKIRVVAKKPRVTDLSLLAYRIYIWDAETMKSLARVDDYGKTANGTGVYKAVQVDKDKGTIVERYEGYNTNTEYVRAPIKRVHGIPMPDRQTQVAQLLVGGVEVLRNVQPDMAKNLARNPNITITNFPAPSIFYIALDSTGVHGNKALSDPRVRLAVAKAIDRDKLIKHLVPGGEVATKLEALCFSTTIGCKYSVKAPEYDPEGAKKLLAEAGYPNGFDMDYLVYQPMQQLGTAVAGELRKVGIRAKVEPATIGLYRRKQGHGELDSWSILFPTGSHPDASNILTIYFNNAVFKYYKDPIIKKYKELGEAEFDPEKRAEYYDKVFSRVNEMHYIFPISSIPSVFAHTKDIVAVNNKLSAGGLWIADFAWKE